MQYGRRGKSTKIERTERAAAVPAALDAPVVPAVPAKNIAVNEERGNSPETPKKNDVGEEVLRGEKGQLLPFRKMKSRE